MSLNTPALSLKNISKTFGSFRALDRVNFELQTGEIHCLAGENGCGKSTLIKIVTGVHDPDSGAEIHLFGEKISHMTPAKAQALGIAVIWQDLSLFPHMSVAENIAFRELVSLLPKVVQPWNYRKRVKAVLHRLGVQLDISSPLGSLTIAQRQIVAIARALISDARILFMDEPTSSLTQSETDSLLELVRKLAEQGVSVVFVSHRLAEVIEISERVTVIRDGKLVGVFPTSGMTQTRLGELMTNQKLVSQVSARDRSDAQPILELERLTRYGEFEEVDLTIRQGEIVGMIGLIGAGRTELAHALIGMTAVDDGKMYLQGKRIVPRNIRSAIKEGISYVSEDRLSLGLIQPQSITDNIAISVLGKLRNRFGLLSKDKQNKLVENWIVELTIKAGDVSNAVSTLSGGNQQRVVLAKWLATEPKLLILDSPTVGVDVAARAGIFKIVRRLADQGLAILLISDEVSEVLMNSDRVVHMENGRLMGEYRPENTSISELEAIVYA